MRQAAPRGFFTSYPRDVLRDDKLRCHAGVGIVFALDAHEVYPDQFETLVDAVRTFQA